jgi:DNA-binding transcriptional LysR family regulator
MDAAEAMRAAALHPVHDAAPHGPPDRGASGREGLTLDHRFELDSYHAIMAMVAEGAGWSILTPLGFMRAGRFRDRAEVVPLPFAPLQPTISLTARRGVLLDLPGRVAERLKPLLTEMIVAPAAKRGCHG